VATVKTYQFTSSGESWSYTVNGDGSGAWQSTGGNTGGCWAINCLGRKVLEQGYLELSTTWEAMGVTAGDIVNEIDASSLDWLCDVYNVADGYTVGALEIRDSGGTLQATLISSNAGSGTTSYASLSNSTPVSIPASIQASDSSIKIRLNFILDTGNNASAEVNLLIDNISLTVDHSAAAVNITPDDTVNASSSDTTSITQQHEIAPVDSVVGSSGDTTSITQVHEIAPIDSTIESTTDETSVDTSVNITPDDSFVSSSSDESSITQVHEISPNESAIESNSDTTSITQQHEVSPNETTNENTTEETSITQIHSISPEDTTNESTTDQTTVTTDGSITPDDSEIECTTDSTSITQVHEIAPDISINESTSEETSITQTHEIAPEESFISSVSGEALIYQVHVISPEDSYIGVTFSSPTITGCGQYEISCQSILYPLKLNRSQKNTIFVNRKKTYNLKIKRGNG
jgi:hypothetical protein